MVKHKSVAYLVAVLVAAFNPASAQEQLRVYILDRIGTATLDRDGYGCFDPLAALRLDSDVAGGYVGTDARDDFGVGSCAEMTSGTSVDGAQRITIRNQTFLRGAVAAGNITVYIPDWSASIASVEDGYDAARMEIALPAKQIAADLRVQVAAYQQCSRESEDLALRIADYNARAEAIDPKRAETGSRLVRGSSAAPMIQVILPDERFRELFEEAQRLQAEVEAHNQRCAEFQDGITLDQDYLAFFEATE